MEPSQHITAQSGRVAAPSQPGERYRPLGREKKWILRSGARCHERVSSGMVVHFVCMGHPQGSLLQGSEFTPQAWLDELSGQRLNIKEEEGRVRPGCGKVDSFCTLLPAVAFSLVLLTNVFCQKPSRPQCTPGPDMIDTLSHYLREDW